MKTNSLKNSAVKHPILHSLLLIIIFEVVMLLLAYFVTFLCPPFFVNNGDFLFQGTIEAFLSAVGIGLVALYGYNSIWEERGRGLWNGLGIGGYFIVIAGFSLILTLISTILTPPQWEVPWKIIVYVLCFLLVGLCEETFYRGIMANIFYDKYARDPAGVWTATIWSGMLFGLMHLFNMLGAPDSQYVVGVLVQTFSACAMGMTLSAIYFRSRNIWSMILIHAFVDICSAFSAGFFKGGSLTDTIGSYTPSMFISAVPYVIVTLVLLRPSKVKEIIDYRRTREALPVHDGKVISTKKNKHSCVTAVIVAVIVTFTLFGLSVYYYNGSMSVNYSATKTFEPGTGIVTEDVALFTPEENANYSVTIQSLPGSQNAYASVYITCDGERVFSATYGGRCSDIKTVWFEANKTYTVTVEYDYTYVDSQEMQLHMISITVK